MLRLDCFGSNEKWRDHSNCAALIYRSHHYPNNDPFRFSGEDTNNARGLLANPDPAPFKHANRVDTFLCMHASKPSVQRRRAAALDTCRSK
jgi:hypothetical protein